MDDLLPPNDGDQSLSNAANERAVTLYGNRETWAERVTADEFLAANPALARHVNAPHEAPSRSALDHLLRLALPLAALAFAAVLLLAGDWKIEHLFSDPAAQKGPERVLLVEPLPRNVIPQGALAPISAINDSLNEKVINWESVLSRAEALRSAPDSMKAVQQSTRAYDWLYEVLTTAHMKLAGNEPHRRRHYAAVVLLDKDFGPQERKRPYSLAFHVGVALFEQAGGSDVLQIAQPSSVPALQILDTVTRVTNGYPAELSKSTDQQRQLLRVETYTRVRMMKPASGGWVWKAPFELGDKDNLANWTRLYERMTDWEKLEKEPRSRELNVLRKVFWGAIQGFSKLPANWRGDVVWIGNNSYSKAEAKRVVGEIESRNK